MVDHKFIEMYGEKCGTDGSWTDCGGFLEEGERMPTRGSFDVISKQTFQLLGCPGGYSRQRASERLLPRLSGVLGVEGSFHTVERWQDNGRVCTVE